MSRVPQLLLAPVLLLVLLGGIWGVTVIGSDSTSQAETSRGPDAPDTTASGTPTSEPQADGSTALVEPTEPDLVVPGRGSLAGAGTGNTAEPAAPRAVRMPGIGVDSSLEDLRIDDDGRLAAPQEWQRVGWFADGTAPGEVGPAVLAGHVDSPTGPAVFARLDDLRPGDRVEVEREDGTVVEFRVDRSQVVGKGDFPTQQVYGPTPDAQLRLITCDGPYVRSSGGYQDNLVVWATAVSA